MYILDVKGKPLKVKRQENALKRGEKSDNYLIHVCSLLWSLENQEKVEKSRALSHHCISCKSRLTKMIVLPLWGSRGEWGERKCEWKEAAYD